MTYRIEIYAIGKCSQFLSVACGRSDINPVAIRSTTNVMTVKWLLNLLSVRVIMDYMPLPWCLYNIIL